MYSMAGSLVWLTWLIRLTFVVLCFFFFQAEDGIRDLTVTGVQTCALPISYRMGVHRGCRRRRPGCDVFAEDARAPDLAGRRQRFEARRRGVRGIVPGKRSAVVLGTHRRAAGG